MKIPEPGYARHNSRISQFKKPYGAIETNSALRLKILTMGKYENCDVTLRLWVENEEKLIPLLKSRDEHGVWHSGKIITPQNAGWIWYYFIIHTKEGDVYYGGESGMGALYAKNPPSYQITVIEKGYKTPKWFKGGIMYQIFPDRFYKGEKHNKGIDYHKNLGRNIRIHNWDDKPCYLPEAGQSVYQPNDFFLGDICGIEQKLPYLKELGVNCIYLNPVFESGSNHRYDTADYKKVDPLLGGNQALKSLVKSASKKGIKIMLDGVFSHTGADSLYFDMYKRYGGKGAFHNKNSVYRNWYKFEGDNHQSYRAWWGFKELPEVREECENYREFIMRGKNSFLAFWAKAGITSYRLDVADELPDDFIFEMRSALKKLDKNGVLLGEVWEDATNKVSYGHMRKYALGNGLDSVMNYPFQNAALSYALGQNSAIGLKETLETLREHYPKEMYYSLMNSISTHDSIRAINVLSGAPHRDALTREQQAEYELTPDMIKTGKQNLIIALCLQAIVPGVPSIYYGDEAGLTGMADPFNRMPFPWDNIDYKLLQAYRLCFNARKNSPAMCRGFFRMGAINSNVFVGIRYTNNKRDAFANICKKSAAVAVCNNGGENWQGEIDFNMLNEGPDADIPYSLDGIYNDVFTREIISVRLNRAEIKIPPKSGKLYAFPAVFPAQ